MFDSAACLRSLYDSGPYGPASLCLLGSVPFSGILSSLDLEQGDTLVVGSHTLQYQYGSTILTAGDLVTIGSKTYKVIGVPQRREDDVTAQVVQQP